MDPINYGFFSWNSLEAKSVPLLHRKNTEKFNSKNTKTSYSSPCDKRITIQDIQDCLLMNMLPPKLRNIETTQTLLGRKLPTEISDSPKQMISYIERPFAYTHAISMYVAQQRGCKLDQIDFLLSGNILGMLHNRRIDRNTVVTLQIKKGILIISKLATEMRNMNSAGCKFERIICEEEYSPTSKLIDHSIIREVTLGNYRVLISTGIDCIDNNQNPIEAKFFEMKQASDMVEKFRTKNLLFQMLSNGATEVVVGSRIFNERKKSSKIINVEKYNIEYVLDYVMKHFYEQSLFSKIIKGLNELRDFVRKGLIKAEPNCFYRMTFKKSATNASDRIMVIEPYMEMKGTPEYCSQYLYDVLISNRGHLRSLEEIKQNHYFFSRFIQPEYRFCRCVSKSPENHYEAHKEKKLSDYYVPSQCFINTARKGNFN